jgi:hypothetical protein
MIDLKKKSRRAINKRYLSAEDIYFPASGDCWAAFDVCSVLYTPIIYKTHTHTSSQPFISSSFFLLSLLAVWGYITTGMDSSESLCIIQLVSDSIPRLSI